MKKVVMAIIAVLFLSGLGINGNKILANEPVAYYPFDGNANDISGNGNDGSISGALLTEDPFGNPESAYFFDGIDDRIQVEDSPSLSMNAISIATWVKPAENQDGNYYVIVGQMGNSYSWAYDTNAFKLEISGMDGTFALTVKRQGDAYGRQQHGTTVAVPDTWYHVCGVYDGSDIYIYVNGILENGYYDGPLFGNLNDCDTPFTFGMMYDGSQPYHGALDEVRIYNYALSPAEVSGLVQTETPQLEWSQTFGGYGEAEGHGLAVNSEGIYLTGRTSLVQVSYTDLFLNRYDLDGNPDWDRTWGGSIWDGGIKVATASNQVYVAGYTYSYAYDPVSSTESDAVTVKYSTDGILDTSNSSDGWWTRFSGDSGRYAYEGAADLAIDDTDNLYVVGDSEHYYNNWYRYTEKYDSNGTTPPLWHQHFGVYGTAINCRGSALTLAEGSLYNVGSYQATPGQLDLLVQKYATDGTPLWNFPWGSMEDENGLDIAVSGNYIYVVGQVGDIHQPGYQDLLLLKLQDNGTSASFVNSVVYSGPDDDIGKGIAIADGKIYLVGSTVSSGNSDALLLVYDTDLNLLGSTLWGGAENDVANDVVIANGKIYVAGTTDKQAFLNAYFLESSTFNTPPVADAGNNIQILSDAQESTLLVGLATDGDDDSLQYRWLENEGVLLDWTPVGGSGEANLDLGTSPYFSIGNHTLTLEVNDGSEISSDEMTLTIDNSPPDAQPAPSAQTVEIGIDPINVIADVSDFDGDLVTYSWIKQPDILLSTGTVQAIQGGDRVIIPALSVFIGDDNFPLGVHQIELRVDDGVNPPVSEFVSVTVSDTQAPSISPIPSVTILWPPNHELHTVVIQANAFDNGGGTITLNVEVASSEPPDTDGDGNTIPDYHIDSVDNETGLINLQLRSERSGKGEGRLYTITITATDTTGNASIATVEIKAPHDKRKK